MTGCGAGRILGTGLFDYKLGSSVGDGELLDFDSILDLVARLEAKEALED